MLKQLKIKGYKSIKDIDLELRSLNVLIGANGAGNLSKEDTVSWIDSFETNLQDFP